MQQSIGNMKSSVTAVLLGDRLDPRIAKTLLQSLGENVNHLLIVLRKKGGAELIDIFDENIAYVEIPEEAKEVGIALTEAIKHFESDYFLLLTGSKTASISRKMQRMAKSKLDFMDLKYGNIMLSKRYAEYISESGEVPSNVHAAMHGFYSQMSFFDFILSPKVAVRKNWTLVKFTLVGASGVIVNLALLTVFIDWFNINAVLANAIAVEVSIINNFLWNDTFTFKLRSQLQSQESSGMHSGGRLARLIKYNLVSLTSLSINLIVFSFLHSFGIWYVYDSLVAILCGFVINYLGSEKWAWRHVNLNP